MINWKNITCLALFYSSIVHSSNAYYECTILDTYSLNNITGKIETTNAKWRDMFKGDKFNVSRLNGNIVGQTLPTEAATQTIVVNKGSSEYNFKAISIFKHPNNEREWQVIQIKEIAETPSKPFIAFSVAGIISGVCK